MRKLVFIFGIVLAAFLKSFSCCASDTTAQFDCHKTISSASLHAFVRFNSPAINVARTYSNESNSLSVSDVETKEVDGKEFPIQKAPSHNLFYTFFTPFLFAKPILLDSYHSNFQQTYGALRCATLGNFRI